MQHERDEALFEVGPVHADRRTGDAPLAADEMTTTQRLKQTESNVTDILPADMEHKNAIDQLQQQVEALQERVEDAEGRSQRNNVRIIALPEGNEGQNPTQYVED
ncbi:hypothetical protein NDU88_010113 [Pleurodeles waltl]|uniref:Uncharacterized protein n=1 Tax=Pleurodeles waltl TaxID=8319 RepID=A0AAV7S2B8_PLEWA|nr:hypothetical protein NDU88_010113 [Pleurodeles waltl]